MTRSTRLGSILCLVLATGATAQSQAPAEKDTTRHLWDTTLIDPPKKSRSRKSRPVRRYRVATPAIKPVTVNEDAVLGVTVWRLRKTRSSDQGARILIQDAQASGEWTPERVSTSTRLREGDRVRLSLEAARTGYLYVIDRELYADGSTSAPYLIFPTTRARGGNNAVAVGRVIEIPAQEDAIPVFTLRRSRSDQVGEILSVLVTSEPIAGLQLGADPMRLSEEDVAKWEQAWGSQVGRLELEGGPGQQWTANEKSAGADGATLLASDAPRPQELYFRPNAKPGDGLLANVKLQYVSTKAQR